MGSDESKLVLFSVPKGFDINKMNEIKGVDIPKEMKKPKTKQIRGSLDSKMITMELIKPQVGEQFTGAAHMR